jgi:uncharacterized coiled-coil protein SlyX
VSENFLTVFELELSKLRQTVDHLNEQLAEARDNADSLWAELELERGRLKEANATIGRLRLHIQQGVEL